MNILFINNLLPFPLDNGGKINTYNTIKALSRNNCVDLLSFINDESERKFTKELISLCDSVQVLHKTVIRGTSRVNFAKDYFKSIFMPTPYVISKFYSKKMRNIITRMQKAKKYDLIYVNHLSMMVYSKYFGSKILLHEQNVESLIFGRFVKETNNPVKKVLGFIEYVKLKNFERKMINIANSVISLSNADQNELIKLAGSNSKKINVISIHIDANMLKFDLRKDDKINLLFMGTMSWYPNQNGILWFLKECFSELDPKKYHLYISGSNPPKEVLNYQQRENITVTGYVDDINDIIKRCDIGIVPLFIGSGQRVKIIESFAKGLPVVSTTIGAEGIITDHENILLADSKNDFVKSIRRLSETPNCREQIRSNARKVYEENYSTISMSEKLNNIIMKLHKKND